MELTTFHARLKPTSVSCCQKQHLVLWRRDVRLLQKHSGTVSSARYLPRGRHRPLPCVFVYARCKQPCIVIIAHCAALGLWLRSPSLETRRSSPMHKIKDGDKMPLICSQLAKCVVNPAKVWMSMSRTKGRAFQPHELTIKKRKKGICLCCAPCTLTPKGRRCWRCCSGWITMSTFPELILKVQSFTFVIIYLHFTNFIQGPVWKTEQHLVAFLFLQTNDTGS